MGVFVLRCDVASVARLLDKLVVARRVDDLVEMGYDPGAIRSSLEWLVEFGFVRAVEYGGSRYYHLTGLGARLLKVLRRAVVFRIVRVLDGLGVGYRVWWGDRGLRAVRPVIYVDRPVDLPAELGELVEIKVAEAAASRGEG